LRTGKNRGSPRKLFRLPPRQLFLAASNVGQILGDHLYFAMVSDRIPIDTIRELYSPLPKKPQAASMKYWHLAGLLPTRRPDQGSKEDRF
jgi:hypothetical protein